MEDRAELLDRAAEERERAAGDWLAHLGRCGGEGFRVGFERACDDAERLRKEAAECRADLPT